MHPLISEHQQELRLLCQAKGIKYLGLFGSFVRGEETAQSDIDLLVETPQDLSLLQLIALEQDLSNLLQRKVDLVDRQSLKTRLQPQVLAEVQEIFLA